MKFKDKNILVCGIARSGISASILLKKQGANVFIQDIKQEQEQKTIKILEKNSINIILGKNPNENLINKMDIIVLSPGIPLDLDFIKYAKKYKQVIGEIELSYLLCSADILAITGTNGKTTTTYLLGEILKKEKNTYIAGNIGIPFSSVVNKAKKGDAIALELSSFQLESINKFRPHIACVLNISKDHLNRHKTMENYCSAKENIFKNQGKNDYLILNYDDKICRDMSEKTLSKVIYFSTEDRLKEGAYLYDDYIYINNEKFMNIDEIKLLGIHNIQNIMAAILSALCYNISYDSIKQAIKSFKGVEHRIEYVSTKKGVDYYNDSKGTNVESTIKAIQSIKKPMYIILGGADKDNDFTELIKYLKKYVKYAVIIGECSEKIANKCDELCYNTYQKEDSMENAIDFCYKNAKNGDVVLLSPACASFDMFNDYEHRGNVFKSYVEKLER